MNQARANTSIRRRCTPLALVMGMLAAVTAPAIADHGTASGHSYTFLSAGHTQEIVGVAQHFVGGLAFAPDGDVWLDDCRASGGHLHRYDLQGVAPQVHGTKLHPETIVPSDAGCGLANRPDGYLYSNTINGVTQIDADTGAPTGLVFGAPGNTLGIAVDPTNKQLVYVGLDNTILTAPVGGASSAYSTATTGNVVHGLSFGPGGLLYATNRSPSFRVTVINPDGTLNRHIPLPSEPAGIAFDAAGGFLLTTNLNGTITRVDIGAGDAISAFAAGGFRGDFAPVGQDGCLYTTQVRTRYDNFAQSSENSVVRICGGFDPSYDVCTPDPRTQGYWHRQCLGAGFISPPGGGLGPKSVQEPGFVNTLVPAVDELLQASILDQAVALTCEDGIATDPPDDPCERALKQYTSVLLNLESERLQGECIIELTEEGCGSATLEDLVTELADLINEGECKQAVDCAAPVNEAWAIAGAAGIVSPMAMDLSGPAPSMQVSTPAAAGTPVEETAPGQPTGGGAAFSRSLRSTATERVPAAKKDAESSSDPAPAYLVGGAPVSIEDPSAGVEKSEVDATAADPADPRQAIERYLSDLQGGALSRPEVRAAEDALLDAASGGYPPELRLRIVIELLDRLDAAYHSLLAKHLERIRDEARGFDDQEVASRAARLLDSLQRSAE